MLNHRVGAAENAEQAMLEPPAGGRARIRGEAIQRLAGAGNAKCDWQHVIDFTEGQVLDLSDPFAREESWGALRGEEGPGGQSCTSRLFGADGDQPYSREGNCYERRREALDLYQNGDYSGAEVLLRGLVQEQFEVASNYCHLARVLILMNRTRRRGRR